MSSETDSPTTPLTIAIIGVGTIGLSFAALHLTTDPTCQIILHDTRPDLESYVSTHLPTYLPSTAASPNPYTTRITLQPTLSTAVSCASIIQESGPEDPTFKSTLWPQIELHAPSTALLWSSTSGIPASVQTANMTDRTRLHVVHPFNPPHIMPLLEIVPSPTTDPALVTRTVSFWRARGRAPVVLQRETTGFVANRLAFALLREACALVSEGTVGVRELDEVVTASMGPRWAVAGPFQSYAAGGGEGGLRGFMEKIGGTVGRCWEAGEEAVRREGVVMGGRWQEEVCRQAEEVYGKVDTEERDRKTRRVLEALEAVTS